MCRRGLLLLGLVLVAASSAAAAYDDYPVVVPKRATLVLDRLLVALQRALRAGEARPAARPAEDMRVDPPAALRVRAALHYDAPPPMPLMPDDAVLLQPRGQGGGGGAGGRGRVLRCYFNAVTCFRRK